MSMLVLLSAIAVSGSELCRGGQCILCDQTTGPYLMPNTIYVASTSCSIMKGGGWVQVPQSLHVPTGVTITGPAGVNGSIVVAGSNVTLREFKMTGHINISNGEELTISNVEMGINELSKQPIRAIKARFKNAKIYNAIPSRHSNTHAMVAMVECTGSVHVECNAGSRIITQRSFKLDIQSATCGTIVDIDMLILAFGASFEVAYYHNFMTKSPEESSFWHTVVFYLAYTAAGLALYTYASGPSKYKVHSD